MDVQSPTGRRADRVIPPRLGRARRVERATGGALQLRAQAGTETLAEHASFSMLLVIQPNLCEYGRRENACGVNGRPRLDDVRLLAVSLTDGHLDGVAPRATARTAANLQTEEIVQRKQFLTRLLSATGSAQVVLEVFESVTNDFEIWLAFLESTDGITVRPEGSSSTPVRVPNSIDDN